MVTAVLSRLALTISRSKASRTALRLSNPVNSSCSARYRKRSTVLSVGSRDQRILNRSGDDLRIDWGYFHLSVPKEASSESSIARGAIQSFASTGHLPTADDMEEPQVVGRGDAHLATELALGSVSSTPVTRHVLVSYTEGYAIQYLERNLGCEVQWNGKPG
jgi:hypothetical protein